MEVFSFAKNSARIKTKGKKNGLKIHKTFVDAAEAGKLISNINNLRDISLTLKRPSIRHDVGDGAASGKISTVHRIKRIRCCRFADKI